MRSNKHQTSSNYLLNTLVDGIKPFRYRVGVRSLLGIPDDVGVRLSFNPNLSPIGFRYGNNNSVNGTYLRQHPVNEPARSAFYNEQNNVIKSPQDILQNNNQQDVPDEKRRMKTPDSFDMNQNKTTQVKAGRKMQKLNDVNTDNDTVSEINQQNVPDEKRRMKTPDSFDMNQNRATQVNAGWKMQIINDVNINNNTASETNQQDVPDEKRRMKIPDSFDMNQNKTTQVKVGRKMQKLNDVNTNNDTASETDQHNVPVKQIEKTGEHGRNINHEKTRIDIPGVSKEKQFSSNFLKARMNDTHLKKVEEKLQKASSVDSEQNCSGKSSIESREKDLWRNSTINNGLVSEKYKKEMRPRGYIANSTTSSENTTTNNVGTDKGGVRTVLTHKPSLHRRDDSSPGFIKRNISSTYKTSGHSGRAGSGFDNRFSTGAANRIEQLRDSVHELATKVATKSSGSTHETKEKQTEKVPVSQTQPVVIVKRSSSQPRVPYAFWERSYLSHFHVGILR